MNKYKIYMIISIIILIISIGTSLAWYVWSSTNNALVNLDVCTPTISFVGGDTLNGTDIIPITNREEGTTKEIDVYLNKTCKEGDSAVMNLYMTLDILPAELQEETFVYEVWKDNFDDTINMHLLSLSDRYETEIIKTNYLKLTRKG